MGYTSGKRCEPNGYRYHILEVYPQGDTWNHWLRSELDLEVTLEELREAHRGRRYLVTDHTRRSDENPLLLALRASRPLEQAPPAASLQLQAEVDKLLASELYSEELWAAYERHAARVIELLLLRNS